MIKFFRHIRQSLLSESKFSRYLLYAIGEIILVVIGILIALQVNDWNEERKNRNEQYSLMNKLLSDLRSDMTQIQQKISRADNSIDNYKHCLDMLADDKGVSREDFMFRFGDILAINQFEQNTTTFDNLVSSGKIELIENESLLDSIVSYYNKDYRLWDSAMRDYTRNIIAPYMMKYDHIPQMNQVKGNDYGGFKEFYDEDIERFKVAPRTMDEYRNDLFIINCLRQKIFNYEGQRSLYLNLKRDMEALSRLIEEESRRLNKE